MTVKDPKARGRGALSNESGRFEALKREAIDDGWPELQEPEGQIRTTLIEETPRTILARNTSPDIPFDRSINPYRGCEHGCIYCYARPTHAYMGLSAGLDFESKLFFKPNAAALLRKELAKPGYTPQPIALGSNTDPYQPVERRFAITRQILDVCLETRHPVTIVTKSNLVLRDLDILTELARLNLVFAAISVTTLDRSVARTMEPRAPTPARRIEALQKLSAAGVPAMVMVAPVIPSLTDHEMEHILETCAVAGVKGAGYVLLRLPHEVSPLFREWLEGNVPARAKRVMSLVQSARGGKDYQAEWGTRMRGEGEYADLIARRFALALKRLGLNKRLPPLDRAAFRPPRADDSQLSLF